MERASSDIMKGRRIPRGTVYLEQGLGFRGAAETGNVVLRYRVNGTEVKDEEFDLVVLSVGLSSPDSNRELADKLSVSTNQYGFCERTGFSPIETSRSGIYACGAFRAPMDIPDSVTMASGAASLASLAPL